MDSNFWFRAISDGGPWSATRSLFKIIQPYLDLPHLDLPGHHDVRASDVDARRLYSNLAAAADRGPTDFADPLLSPGVGAPTVRALAMVAEVVHGAPYRFTDPARFSLAHGGKDRHPFPVPLRVYDETIRVVDGYAHPLGDVSWEESLLQPLG